MLAVPPDLTRRDSRPGELTQHAYDYYGGRLEAVLPALGTHIAMSSVQLTSMFGKMPHELFRIHNWRADAETLGEVGTTFIHEQEGKVNYAWPAQVNRLVVHGGFDLVLSRRTMGQRKKRRYFRAFGAISCHSGRDLRS